MSQNDEAFRFSAYWIALEILVAGKSDTIRSTLAKAYNQDKKSFSDTKLYFKEIETIRHYLMHKGIFGVMQSYHERLLQLYFWDIVMYQIGLSNYGLAVKLADDEVVLAEKNRRR
jgi:hypothetical protein